MGVYQDTLDRVSKMLAPFSIVMQNNSLRNGLISYINHFFENNVKIGHDRIKTASRIWKKDFLTYLLLTKPFKTDINQSGYYKPIGVLVDSIFKGEGSLPSVITLIHRVIENGNKGKELTPQETDIYNRFKNNLLINVLSPNISTDNPIHNLSLVYRNKDSSEHNKLVEDWRELFIDFTFNGAVRNIGIELALFTIAQSGVQNSPVSFVDSIPFELYTQIAKSVIESEITEDDLINYTVQTLINNYTNNDMVKKVKAKSINSFNPLTTNPLLYPIVKVFEVKEEFQYNSMKEIIEMTRKGIKVWKLKPTLYITSTKEEIPDFGNYQNNREGVNRVVYGTKEMNEFSRKVFKNFIGLIGGNEVEYTDYEMVEEFQYPELATIGTPEQYSQYLDTILSDSKVMEINDSLYNSVLNQLEQENKIEKDCTGGGKLKAEDGIRTKFTKGSQWEIVKDLKGYPSHSQGGVDIKLGKNGFSFTRDNGIIEAKHGLVLPKIK